ncbi:MAG: hypothetical protein K2X93_23020 [Candidatus Obscuribacterales bacterium]|nr:hypothetical protein [Candidatus Obscuribacterales bacterium]
MLTEREQKLIVDIGKIMGGFAAIQKEALDERPDHLQMYDGDNVELCATVHQLQNWVLSNSAARSHPLHN